MTRFEPRTSDIRSDRSTNESQPLPIHATFFFFIFTRLLHRKISFLTIAAAAAEAKRNNTSKLFLHD